MNSFEQEQSRVSSHEVSRPGLFYSQCLEYGFAILFVRYHRPFLARPTEVGSNELFMPRRASRSPPTKYHRPTEVGSNELFRTGAVSGLIPRSIIDRF
ncbi:hypothetical protein VNI00_012487 [Paramarasmius palmivorus]|uniref:Uncharacterized protein n=1 Tax=Paramarasmius palmivorus TaxID=297713 RepID=A0AAW0C5C0_9AGAR